MLTYASVIVTFNRKASVREALLRQFNQTVQAQKIIVVDNASTDGTHKYIEDILQSHAEQVKYLRLDENLGGSGGFYYGMKEALNEHTDLIGISDDDASYDEDYFEKIIKAAENNPKDMAFCGAMYDYGKMTAETAGTAKHLLSDNTLKFQWATKDEYLNGDFYVDNWSFVGPVFRSKLVEQIGLPNKDFFIWFDDSEYAVRMHQLGYKYHVVVNAHINLNSDVKAAQVPLWKKYYGFRNEIYTIKKYGKNKVISNTYPFYMLLRKYASVYLKNSEFKGRRSKALKIFTKAFNDGMGNRLGKSIDPADKGKY